MPHAYTVLWTNDHCEKLKRLVPDGTRLEVLFGGTHQSAPSFRRFGVEPGDAVYPVRVHQGRLYVLGRMYVDHIVDLQEYLMTHLGLSAKEADESIWDLEDRLWRERPSQAHLLPAGCVNEAAIGSEGTPIVYDRALPAQALSKLRFSSKRGERGLKHVENGLLTRAISLQGGIYRLTPESTVFFERAVAAEI